VYHADTEHYHYVKVAGVVGISYPCGWACRLLLGMLLIAFLYSVFPPQYIFLMYYDEEAGRDIHGQADTYITDR
jgi:hypothetical protein